MISVVRYFTNGLAQGSDVKDGVSQVTSADVKGQLLTVAAEVGVNDIGSDGYQ